MPTKQTAVSLADGILQRQYSKRRRCLEQFHRKSSVQRDDFARYHELGPIPLNRTTVFPLVQTSPNFSPKASTRPPST